MENNFDIHQWQAKFLREDSSRKLTAVEWLEKQLIHQKRLLPEHFNKAKQMEKEQIFDALEEFVDTTIPPAAKEEYYNDRYK